MHLPVLPRRKAVRRAGFWAAIGFSALQILTAATLMVTDKIAHSKRKVRATPNPGMFHAEVDSSQLTLYTSGADLFDDMIDAIESAKELVLFQTFIWKSDSVGQRFMDALNAAARRGVSVYVMFDVFGNMVVGPKFYRQLDPAIRVKKIYPIERRFFSGPIRATGLNHSKVLVVDDRVGFVGGLNIGEAYESEWRDTHLRETGPAVWGLRQAFANMWNENTRKNEQKIDWIAPDDWNPRVDIAPNMPVQLVYPIRRMYMAAIERAKKRIWLNTPYFVPDQNLFRALLSAARRGVDVRVMMPKRNNHIVADWVARGFYDDMLSAGVQILLYEPAMIHAKTAVIDGKWATIGTANLDRLSLALNYETNIEVTDEGFAREVEKIFLSDAQHCEVIDPGHWVKRPLRHRIAEFILAPLRPLM